SLHYDAAWGLNALEIESAGKTVRSKLATEVRLLVPDALAGTAVTVKVWGLRGQEAQRFGEGHVELTPIKGKEVSGTVTMLLAECEDSCSAGATTCMGDGVATC